MCLLITCSEGGYYLLLEVRAREVDITTFCVLHDSSSLVLTLQVVSVAYLLDGIQSRPSSFSV